MKCHCFWKEITGEEKFKYLFDLGPQKAGEYKVEVKKLHGRGKDTSERAQRIRKTKLRLLVSISKEKKEKKGKVVYLKSRGV